MKAYVSTCQNENETSQRWHRFFSASAGCGAYRSRAGGKRNAKRQSGMPCFKTEKESNSARNVIASAAERYIDDGCIVLPSLKQDLSPSLSVMFAVYKDWLLDRCKWT